MVTESTAEMTIKEKIAIDILDLARSTLLVNFRFLSAAIAKLPLECYEGSIATDGMKIYYDPDYVITLYKTSKEHAIRAYLHIILHCLFLHPFSHTEWRLWNLACDIATETIIDELNLPCTDIPAVKERKTIAQSINKKTKFLTAEKIYAYLRSEKLSQQTLQYWEKLFAIDEHSQWQTVETALAKGGTQQDDDADQSGSSKQADDNEPGGTSDWHNSKQPSDGTSSHSAEESLPDASSGELLLDYSHARASAVGQEWKELSGRLMTDLETFSRQWGTKAGSMIMSLKEANRKKYDYANFLQRFSVLSEEKKINNDEFDYVFYTLGLNLYGNMPLVESLEYRDVKRIKEFVIAIDTSGSVAGSKVRAFIRRTYDILKSQEGYHSKVNIHIIQCDATIQMDTKITSVDELERVFADIKLLGFGGTDFRPVFNYVDKQIASGELKHLNGLIYFTDGWGHFPEQKPSYNTAFVFVDDDYNNYDVPPWAIKIIVESQDIKDTVE